MRAGLIFLQCRREPRRIRILALDQAAGDGAEAVDGVGVGHLKRHRPCWYRPSSVAIALANSRVVCPAAVALRFPAPSITWRRIGEGPNVYGHGGVLSILSILRRTVGCLGVHSRVIG